MTSSALESELLSYVGLAQVLAGAQPFREGNVSDTYRGLIRTADGTDAPAIIKDLKPRELANEVFGAAVGLRLGLPIPRPYVALASQDRLAAQHGPRSDDETGRLVFASVDVAQPQVAMLCRAGTPHAVLTRLMKWRHLGRTYGFDTLIANIDRHAGNLLFNGDKEVWLIDHGHAFTGPDWKIDDFDPADVQTINRLSSWLTPHLSSEQRGKLQMMRQTWSKHCEVQILLALLWQT